MRIHEIWEVPLLKKKVYEVQAKLRKGQDECFLDENGNPARMIEMISPISYHQAEEIAGFLGMGYEQSSLNEDELETLNWAVKMRMENLLEELKGHIKLRREFAFSFAYDPDGNFGLILYQKGGKKDVNEKPHAYHPIPCNGVSPASRRGLRKELGNVVKDPLDFYNFIDVPP